MTIWSLWTTQQTKCFQTVIRLQTLSNNYNSGIARIKGFAIHLPISLEETNRYIADTLPSIETLSIIINGLPTKSQIIWSSLVDLDKVTQALLWQKLNNRLYDNLTINNIDQQ